MKSPLIIGHRGAPERAVENTEASIRAALNEGALLIETDVRLTADGCIVLSHDPDFSRLGGPSTPIRRMPSAEIRKIRLTGGPGSDQAPLFMDHALRLFPRARFNVDLKDPGPALVAAWCRLLEESGAAHRCRTASFHDRSLRLYRRLRPGAALSAARFRVITILLCTLMRLPCRPRSGEGVLQIPEKRGIFRLITPRRLHCWHRWGWKVHAWTIDTESDMKRLASWGLDGIITNRPSLLRRILGILEVNPL